MFVSSQGQAKTQSKKLQVAPSHLAPLNASPRNRHKYNDGCQTTPHIIISRVLCQQFINLRSCLSQTMAGRPQRTQLMRLKLSQGRHSQPHLVQCDIRRILLLCSMQLSCLQKENCLIFRSTDFASLEFMCCAASSEFMCFPASSYALKLSSKSFFAF